MAIGSRCDGRGLGLPLADPIIGLLMTMAIVAVLRGAVRDIFRRLMDGVDPGLVDAAEAALAAGPGVTEVRSVKMRRIGPRLHADAELDIDPATSLADAHRIAHEAEHPHPRRAEGVVGPGARIPGDQPDSPLNSRRCCARRAWRFGARYRGYLVSHARPDFDYVVGESFVEAA